jgi:hypothetical protein
MRFLITTRANCGSGSKTVIPTPGFPQNFEAELNEVDASHEAVF